MVDNCAVSVVPLPSGASHLLLIVPLTPVAKGVITTSLGLLSLSGVLKKPHTTGPFVVGWTSVDVCRDQIVVGVHRLPAGKINIEDCGGKCHGSARLKAVLLPGPHCC